jgi:hypothetical protein
MGAAAMLLMMSDARRVSRTCREIPAPQLPFYAPPRIASRPIGGEPPAALASIMTIFAACAASIRDLIEADVEIVWDVTTRTA